MKLTNWILDSGETCHITPDISGFIPVSFLETDIYIEVADRNFITAKKIGQFQIRMHNNNGKPFISALYKRDIGTKFVRSIIFHYYINEFGTYLPFS